MVKYKNVWLNIRLSIIFCAIVNIANSQEYPPSCVIVTPHSNAYFSVGSLACIRAYATDFGKTDMNGAIVNIEFFANDVSLGIVNSHTNNIYSLLWTIQEEGEYLITARATNRNGVGYTSTGVYVTAGSEEIVPKGISADKGKILGNIMGNFQANDTYFEYWNGVTSENSCKWAAIEGNRDVYNWYGADIAYHTARVNYAPFCFHALVNGGEQQSWLYALVDNEVEFKAEFDEFLDSISNRYKYLDEIIVLQEPLGTHAPNMRWYVSGFGGIGETGYDWAIYLFQRARHYFPNSKLLVNDFGMNGDSATIAEMLELTSVLRDRGLIDGIGAESHDFIVDALTAEEQLSGLNYMATSGIPVYITELDLRGGIASENNGAEQLSSYQTHFPIFWEHPAVASIYLWGYVSGNTWRTGTGLVSQEGVEKPALIWLQEYLNTQSNVGYPFSSATEQTGVELRAGWNLIGSPLNGTVSLPEALSNIWDKVQVVKSTDGFMDKSVPEYMHSLESLEWGRGYLLYTTENCTWEWRR